MARRRSGARRRRRPAARSSGGAPVPRPFRFRPVGRPSDGTIALRLEQRSPADPAKGHVPCYHFGIVLARTGRKVGELRFRVGTVRRTPALGFAGHIGYAVDPPFRGRRYAGRAVRLLRPLVRSHGFRSLVITCDPTNEPSRRTLRRLGAVPVGEFSIPPDHAMYAAGKRRVLRFLWRVPARGGPARRPGAPASSGRRSGSRGAPAPRRGAPRS